MPDALVLADDARERQYLLAACRRAGYAPTAYPHLGAYRLHLDEHRPDVCVVLLSLPLEPKIAVAQNARRANPEMPLVLVGKSEWLAETALFAGDPHTHFAPTLDQLELPAAERRS